MANKKAGYQSSEYSLIMRFQLNQIAIPRPLIGDWVILLSSLILIIFLFKTLWHTEVATKLQVRQGNKIYASYSLNQSRQLIVHGPLGDTKIAIENGRVRFVSSPCQNQYCVHQGWLTHGGQIAICLPNQMSIELIGQSPVYDSLNY
jgi:hypothetical protein